MTSWKNALALALLAACAPSPQPNAPADATSAAAGEPIPDASDRCTVLPKGCPTFEDDGCPDVEVGVDAACAPDERTAALLREAAAEMLGEPRLTRVVLHGDAGAAACIRDALVRAGVDGSRLVTSAGSRPVGFEVGAWDGRDCGAVE